jgi:hypothetical protein
MEGNSGAILAGNVELGVDKKHTIIHGREVLSYN